MDISYFELKEAIYIGLGIFGIILLFIAWSLIRSAGYNVDPALNIVPGIILCLAGMTCIFFALQVFFHRDEPEIWM
jgi:hypothetical protein